MAHPRTLNSQRGMVLLLALVALLLISAVGAAILYMASTETTFVGAQRQAAKAYYAAGGGLEEARYRMMPANRAPTGFNYTDTTAANVGPPIIPCTLPGLPLYSGEEPGTLAPCLTDSGVAGWAVPAPARNTKVLYVINTAAPAPPPPNQVVNQPATTTNDPFVLNEIPALTPAEILTTGSIQANAGTASSIQFSWVRINLKTERTSGVDFDLNNVLDDEPIFYYQTRQYRLTDLNAFDPNVLPAPWGPLPPPNDGRPCVAAVCASPIYTLTAFSQLIGNPPAKRILRSDVAAVPAFAMNAAVLSQPPMTVSGKSYYVGYDLCDTDCPSGTPGALPFNLNSLPTTAPPNCNYEIPLQSQSSPPPPADESVINGATATVYPQPPCPNCAPGNNCQAAGACVAQGQPFPYDIDQLINMLRPMATPLAPATYTAGTLPAGALGRFPANDPWNGTGAVPAITIVDGDLHLSGGITGAGILIVNGNLDFTASMQYYGIIIVRGDVKVTGVGNPSTGCNIYGALLAGGPISTSTALGGGICFWYNSCAQKNLFKFLPMVHLAFREIAE